MAAEEEADEKAAKAAGDRVNETYPAEEAVAADGARTAGNWEPATTKAAGDGSEGRALPELARNPTKTAVGGVG